MFTVKVETRFFASHQLRFPDGAEEKLHNHNWHVSAVVSREKLDNMGLVVDFHKLKKQLESITADLVADGVRKNPYFEHHNPSAENVAYYIYTQLAEKLDENVTLESVSVVEEPGCTASYGRRTKTLELP